MHSGLTWLLLVLSCLSLIGLGFSGLLVSRAQAEREKRDARMASVSTSHIRVKPIEVSAFTRAPRTRNHSPLALAGTVFGFDPEKPEQYPLRWWMILLITLGVAKIAQSLGDGLLGNLSYIGMLVVWVLISRYIFGWAEARRRGMLLRQFPDALAMIVRSVRVGIPVLEAIRSVAREIPTPTGPEFARLVDQVSIGVSLEEAVMEMARRAGIPEYRFFATALSLQNQTGGTLSETLENLADVIRKRVALVAKGKAMASEARTSAIVLASLPVVTGAALWLLSPGYFGVLFNDRTGQTIFGTAVLSLCTGLMIIRVIIRKSLP